MIHCHTITLSILSKSLIEHKRHASRVTAMFNERWDHKQILLCSLPALWHCPKHHWWLPHTNRQPVFLRVPRRWSSRGPSSDGLNRKRTIAYQLPGSLQSKLRQWMVSLAGTWLWIVPHQTNFEGIWPKYNHLCLMGDLGTMWAVELPCLILTWKDLPRCWWGEIFEIEWKVAKFCIYVVQPDHGECFQSLASGARIAV